MSKVLKPTTYIALDDRKLIDVADIPISHPSPGLQKPLTDEERQELAAAHELKEQIISDAEAAAEAELRRAMEEASEMKQKALDEIDGWWNERRSYDEEVVEAARREGLQVGFQEGHMQAEEQVMNNRSALLDQAKAVLQEAYAQREQIIREAEPFLIDMACAIAEKIIQHELTASPDWIIGMTRTVLNRKREKGTITLCVAPEHFATIQGAREDLLLAVDSQAEFQIIPDSSVSDPGCVVRTAYGSIDARVDTQLKEIKQALQMLSLQDKGEEEE